MNSQNVITGSAILRVAPIGTVLPDLTVSPIVWDAAWKQVGYTAAGVELHYQPTFKAITVDEENSPIDQRMTDEKATISTSLAEATIANLQMAMAGASAIASVAAVGGAKGTKTITVGSAGAPAKSMVSLEAPNPDGLSRVVIGYKAIATGNVALAFKKNENLVIPTEFSLLADSSRSAGDRLFRLQDQSLT